MGSSGLSVKLRTVLLLTVWSIRPASAAAYNPASLAAELRQLQEQTRAGHTITFPPAWDVETAGGEYSISSQPLRAILDSTEKKQAAEWLDHLAQTLEESAEPATGSASSARAKLDRILARREFAGVAPPGAWDLFLQRVAAWIRDLLDRIFGFVRQYPATSRILFWTILAVASGILVVWLVRWGHGDRTILTLRPPHQAPPARVWAEWIAFARQAADRGDLREAIRCAYWAGVARLQETGVLTPELTHTPREYLRFVSASGAAPVKHLAALTNGLERFWYAGRAAGIEDFRDSLKNLEELGCRTD